MLKKYIYPALWGLVAAAIILFALPRFNGLLTNNDIMSFKEAVRIASPAVVNVYNRSFSSRSESVV